MLLKFLVINEAAIRIKTKIGATAFKALTNKLPKVPTAAAKLFTKPVSLF